MTFDEWKRGKGKEIAEMEGYKKSQQTEYKMYIDLIIKRYQTSK